MALLAGSGRETQALRAQLAQAREWFELSDLFPALGCRESQLANPASLPLRENVTQGAYRRMAEAGMRGNSGVAAAAEEAARNVEVVAQSASSLAASGAGINRQIVEPTEIAGEAATIHRLGGITETIATFTRIQSSATDEIERSVRHAAQGTANATRLNSDAASFLETMRAA